MDVGELISEIGLSDDGSAVSHGCDTPADFNTLMDLPKAYEEDYAEEVLQDENATAKDKMEAQKVIEEQQGE